MAADQSHAMPGHRSYHLSSLYSPWRLTSFGALAVQFLEAKDSLLGLQGFVNGVLSSVARRVGAEEARA